MKRFSTHCRWCGRTQSCRAPSRSDSTARPNAGSKAVWVQRSNRIAILKQPRLRAFARSSRAMNHRFIYQHEPETKCLFFVRVPSCEAAARGPYPALKGPFALRVISGREYLTSWRETRRPRPWPPPAARLLRRCSFVALAAHARRGRDVYEEAFDKFTE
ncbi:hypothetical protein EVAR_7820_1 [Eumeta japonica]|uniref:Uncharacterized protein n=1 Tax=Eumeta variegata TaxID=151549 RepID=A0A4C1TUZ1_EUMVA|nr:hypothetical protein EVAR_7820_1 [Eumeta japonica]